MRSPYQRPARRGFSCLQLLLLLVGAVVIFFAWQQISRPPAPAFPDGEMPPVTPTMPISLSRADVLPTPTTDAGAPRRSIEFPGALIVAPIITAIRTADSWETRYLGDAVGLLEGTSWLDDPGGNIVLAGHVETALGAPGPFAHLFEALPGDEVILREGERTAVYRVVTVERAAPDAMEYVAQDGRPRLTLITCSDWSFTDQTYLSRLIVVAEPVSADQ